MKSIGTRIALFTLAGVATAPGFMDSFREALGDRLRSQGFEVAQASLYPYGDWHRRLLPQMLEIVRDITDIHERLWKSAGARLIKEHVFRAAEAGYTIILAGHSGGGVTAVQLAGQLAEAGYALPLVVQIGSPKCPIRCELKDSVLFLAALERHSGRRDPVVRLGSWGGWERWKRQVPLWKKDAWKPGHAVDLHLMGGHPDYFRSYAPYMNEKGESNLELTLRPLLCWLGRKLSGSSFS